MVKIVVAILQFIFILVNAAIVLVAEVAELEKKLLILHCKKKYGSKIRCQSRRDGGSNCSDST